MYCKALHTLLSFTGNWAYVGRLHVVPMTIDPFAKLIKGVTVNRISFAIYY